MSGILPSFLSGSQLVIKIGGQSLAFCQALSFSHNMSTAPVGGIGGASYHSLEPLQYSASGSLVVTRYSRDTLAMNGVATGTSGNPLSTGAITPGVSSVPGVLARTTNDKNAAGTITQGGNSLLMYKAFNPLMLLLSTTFDISVYTRSFATTGTEDADLTQTEATYTIVDCRCTGWRTSLSPGGLMNETLTFIARSVTDHSHTDYAAPSTLG
jgi:hypothetical protein